MKNIFLALISIMVLCISTNSAAYSKDIANNKQSETTVAMMKSGPAYKVGFVSGYAGKDEFDVTTCAQFQNQSQQDCQKAYDAGFLSNPAHTQSISFKWLFWW